MVLIYIFIIYFIILLIDYIICRLYRKDETFPKTAWDVLFWPVVKVLWETYSIKHAHFWHWKKYDKSRIKKYLIANGNNNLKERNSWFDNLVELNFRRNQCVIIKAKNTKNKYQVGFSYRNETKKSSILINPEQKFAMLLSPESTIFFAVDIYGNEIELEQIGFNTKYNLKRDKIPLY